MGDPIVTGNSDGSTTVSYGGESFTVPSGTPPVERDHQLIEWLKEREWPAEET